MPLPVMIVWWKKPDSASIARRPFWISESCQASQGANQKISPENWLSLKIKVLHLHAGEVLLADAERVKAVVTRNALALDGRVHCRPASNDLKQTDPEKDLAERALCKGIERRGCQPTSNLSNRSANYLFPVKFSNIPSRQRGCAARTRSVWFPSGYLEKRPDTINLRAY
jgi:hypothetical protein